MIVRYCGRRHSAYWHKVHRGHGLRSGTGNSAGIIIAFEEEGGPINSGGDRQLSAVTGGLNSIAIDTTAVWKWTKW